MQIFVSRIEALTHLTHTLAHYPVLQQHGDDILKSQS